MLNFVTGYQRKLLMYLGGCTGLVLIYILLCEEWRSFEYQIDVCYTELYQTCKLIRPGHFGMSALKSD
jgi:hypothetical protein